MPENLTRKSRDQTLASIAWLRSRKLKPGQTGTEYDEGGVYQNTGRQLTVSEGHPWPPPKRSPGDVGGSFFTRRQYIGGRGGESFAPYDITDGKSSARYVYRDKSAFFAVQPEGSNWPTLEPSSDESLAAFGTTAIANCAPTNPPADLAVGLAELLREGLPRLVGSSLWESRLRGIPRGAGSEYLNVVFGWQPLIQEITDSVNAIAESDKILKQYERDAGRRVRRRFEAEPLVSTTSTTQQLTRAEPWSPGTVPKAGAWKNGSGPTPGSLTRETIITRKRWFSGAFTYHLPKGYHSRNAVERSAARASVLLGLEITPEVLWNLMPWSWAVDWVVNIGDVLSNVSDAAKDGLVLEYGYVMEHSIAEANYTLEGVTLSGYPSTFTTSLVVETKKRIRATPFGFGISDLSFTDRQLAILAALGISRR